MYDENQPKAKAFFSSTLLRYSDDKLFAPNEITKMRFFDCFHTSKIIFAFFSLSFLFDHFDIFDESHFDHPLIEYHSSTYCVSFHKMLKAHIHMCNHKWYRNKNSKKKEHSHWSLLNCNSICCCSWCCCWHLVVFISSL